MKGSFQLREKTAVLTGPLTQVHQALVTRLTELGCNVAMLGAEMKTAERFANQIMDFREIHAHSGRAAAITVDFSDPKSITEAISRAAESFGGVDIYIDGLLAPSPIAINAKDVSEAVQSTIQYELLATLNTTQAALRFLKGRRRGRILYLIHDLYCHGHPAVAVNAAARTGLISFCQALAHHVRPDNIGVNCLRLGLTEEYLLQLFPGKSLAEAEKLLALDYPRVEISRPEDIANLVAFFASPLSQTLSGQSVVAHRGLV